MKKFTTSHGSTYTFLPETCTSIRFKRSGGSNQGQRPPMNVRFVKEKLPLYNPQYQCVPGLYDCGIFYPYHSNTDMVIIRERESGRIVSYVSASNQPRIGLRPFEWAKRPTGGYEKHLGNTIVSITTETTLPGGVKVFTKV